MNSFFLLLILLLPGSFFAMEVAQQSTEAVAKKPELKLYITPTRIQLAGKTEHEKMRTMFGEKESKIDLSKFIVACKVISGDTEGARRQWLENILPTTIAQYLEKQNQQKKQTEEKNQ